jgi:hypothetical protein
LTKLEVQLTRKCSSLLSRHVKQLRARLEALQRPKERWDASKYMTLVWAVQTSAPVLSDELKRLISDASMRSAEVSIDAFSDVCIAMGAPSAVEFDAVKAKSQSMELLQAKSVSLTDVTEASIAGVAVASAYESVQEESSSYEAVNAAIAAYLLRAKVKVEELVMSEVALGWNVGARFAGNQIPGIKAVWDATLDKRVCRRCLAADREVVDWGDSFIIGVTQPPAHTRCRCVMRPWMEHWPSGQEYVNQTGNERFFDILA